VPGLTQLNPSINYLNYLINLLFIKNYSQLIPMFTHTCIFLYGVAVCNIHWLQAVMNAAARPLTGTANYEHVRYSSSSRRLACTGCRSRSGLSSRLL
jgi:hypothetical protein